LSRLKVGVIGCGPVAQKGHLPGLIRSKSAQIEAIADIDEKTLQKTAKKFHVPKTFTNYQEMIDGNLDLVHVCVPNHLHSKVTIDVLKKGINVLVEKPLAPTVREAEQMVEIADQRHVKLCEAKQWRYIPAMRKAHSLLKEGKLGRLIRATAQWHADIPLSWSHANWYYDTSKSGGGIVSDIGIHMIDLLLLFGGPVKRVSAAGGDFLGTMGFDTSVQALLEYENGGTGILDVSWVGPYANTFEIMATAGLAYVDMLYQTLVHASYSRNPLRDLFQSIRIIGRTSLRVLNGDFDNPMPKLYAALIDDFADTIRTDHEPPISGRAALEALRVKDAIYTSIAEKDKVQVGAS
jgi:UDP-N-acetylglucosamine 3-dehydrogenase